MAVLERVDDAGLDRRALVVHRTCRSPTRRRRPRSGRRGDAPAARGAATPPGPPARPRGRCRGSGLRRRWSARSRLVAVEDDTARRCSLREGEPRQLQALVVVAVRRDGGDPERGRRDLRREVEAALLAEDIARRADVPTARAAVDDRHRGRVVAVRLLAHGHRRAACVAVVRSRRLVPSGHRWSRRGRLGRRRTADRLRRRARIDDHRGHVARVGPDAHPACRRVVDRDEAGELLEPGGVAGLGRDAAPRGRTAGSPRRRPPSARP